MVSNLSQTKLNNQFMIIETLLSHGDMSRASLAKKLNLSKPAAADNVEALIAEGLVIEIGEGRASPRGGRKPRLLRFNHSYRGIVVLDIQDVNPMIAIGDLSGEVVAKKTVYLDRDLSNSSDAEIIIHEIKKLALEQPHLPIGVIVITSPGIFAEDNTLLYVHPKHLLANAHLEDTLSKAFAVPIVIKNDMNAAVLGEHSLGMGIGSKDMAFISCGHGIGAGLIIDSKLHEGKNFEAGELSFLTTPRIYKSTGTIEEYLTTTALLKNVVSDIHENQASDQLLHYYVRKKSLTFDDIVKFATNGDSYLLEKIRKMAFELGILIANVCSLLDVEKIVLGGEILSIYKWIETPINEALKGATPFPPLLQPSILGDSVVLFGGVVFGRNRLLQELKLLPV